MSTTMELLFIALAIFLIGFLGAAANEFGVDTRDTFNTEPTGLA
jgi:hypothetical protein